MSPISNQKPIFTATDNDLGQRVDNYLLKQCKQLDKATCYKLIRKGQIRINGKRIKPLQKLNAGDQVRVPPFVFFVEAKVVHVPNSVQLKLLKRIIYEDADYLVLNKPAGIPCHTGTGHDYGVIEVIGSISQYKDIQLAHRLDKDTSGCLLLAKNRASLVNFQTAMKNQQVTKSYLAVLEGDLAVSIAVNQPLNTEQRVNGIRHVVISQTGKTAHTTFVPIKRLAEFTLADCQISTGRTHQIRVHAQHLGHSIVGDAQYGSQTAGLNRKIYLHAHKLKFNHNQWIAPIPKAFSNLTNL